MDKFHLILKTAFASEYVFAIKAQNFHWNVEGPNFPQYHELFGKIYEEVYESIDEFAENIRKVGTYTPASLQRFSMLTQIDDETSIIPAEQMLAELYEDSEKMVKMLKVVFEMSERVGEPAISDFIASRLDAHQKHSWMLRATLK